MTVPGEGRRTARAVLFGVALTVALSASAFAQDWDALSEDERQALRPFSSQWDQLTARQRQGLTASARRWIELPPERREALSARMAIWQGLSEQERDDLLEHRDTARQRHEERQLRELRRRFAALPESERGAAIERFRGMSRSERRAFLAGLSVGARGADRPELRALMQSLEPEERRALWRRIARLDAATRETLQLTMAGLDPGHRTALARKIAAAESDQDAEKLIQDGQ